MQVHGPDEVIRQVNVGEYHTGAVAIYLGPLRIVTYTTDDCDMLIAAACEAKEKHAGVLNPGRAALPNLDHVLPMLRAKIDEFAAETAHVAIEGTA